MTTEQQVRLELVKTLLEVEASGDVLDSVTRPSRDYSRPVDDPNRMERFRAKVDALTSIVMVPTPAKSDMGLFLDKLTECSAIIAGAGVK